MLRLLTYLLFIDSGRNRGKASEIIRSFSLQVFVINELILNFVEF